MSRPLLVAIVGSGPSGFYAAEALLKQTEVPVHVDLFDRLPTPFGLVRGGVAPDHQKIKTVTKIFDKTAAFGTFRFFGNVELGRDLTSEDLKSKYDRVVYAVGCATDRKLGIPGEDLPGSYSATQFVGWYNGHPDFRAQSFDLSRAKRVVILGQGNVAIDVARILAEDPAELAPTDISQYALDALKKSGVQEITLIGRRGPGQAAFTTKEIQELGELSITDFVVRSEDVNGETPATKPEDERATKNLEVLRKAAALGEGSKARKIRLRFLLAPAELQGDSSGVRGVRLERTRLETDAAGATKAVGTGEFEELEADLVFRSVGYHGVPIAGVPFDAKKGRVQNADGRVADGTWVVGWAKRGPSGVIATNKTDSFTTMKLMMSELGTEWSAQDRSPATALALVRAKQPRVVSYDDWKILDGLETQAGAGLGKVRDKFHDVGDMLDALAKARETAPT